MLHEAGFTVAPLNIIRANDFRNEQLIYTAIILGAGLLALSFISTARQIKAHFALTYRNFGTHILFISLLAALFHFDQVFLFWFFIFAAVAVPFFMNALQEGSLYFLVITILYAYIAMSYVMVNLFWRASESEGIFYLALIYFIASGIGLIRILIHYNKMLKNDTRS